MNCYSCEHSAVNACKRCAQPYCDEHGNAQYCADCLRPASALPSFNLYRGALLTMLVGTAVAVFLLVRPPGETNSASPIFVGRTVPTESRGDATPSAAPATPRATSTPSTPTPEPSATASPFGEYIVQDGDTLISIAEANLPAGDDSFAFAQAIATLNGLDFDAPLIDVGDTLLLPRPPAE